MLDRQNTLSRRSFVAAAAGLSIAALGAQVAFAAEEKDEKETDDKEAEEADDDAEEAEGAPKWDKESVADADITAVGSTALQPLVEAAAEQYMEAYDNVMITVQGGGSGQGLSQVSQGAVQIGNSDVFAEEKDIDPATLIDNKVAIAGMGPVANPDCGVTDISMEDLKAVFTGAITNWSELGGADEDIVVINRASGSGTRATFENAVLDGEEAVTAQEQDSSGTVANMVAQTPGAISYLAFNYFDGDLVALSVDGVEPTAENVETNAWTIWAYEHMYTSTEPDEATQAFIDYMLSDAVQGSLVEEMGYIPVTGMQVERAADGTVSEL